MSEINPPNRARPTAGSSPARPMSWSSTSSTSPSFVVGVTGLIGLVFAYVNRGKAGGYVETHYTWLIRTFWIGLLYALISAVLMLLVIGFVLMFAVAVWFIVRCIIGLQALGRNEPIKNPESWLI